MGGLGRILGVGLALLVSVGCDDDEAERPAPAPEPAAAEEPVEDPGPPVAAPPPDFDGNWYVLEEGQTLAQFAESIGIAPEIVRTRARQVERRWLTELEQGIETRFPQVKEAWGGAIRLPRAGFSYTITEGEDLWTLVDEFKTSAVELLVVNGLGPDDAAQMTAGRRIVIPGIVRKVDGDMVRLPHPAEPEVEARARELDLGTVRTASQLLFGHMEDRWMDAAGGRTFSGTINWPVAGGWFVRGFGSGAEGYHLAVDVAGNIGWPARSVDAGIVAYVGDGIRGYGNIVMVIHPGGFVSFYAHLSASFVHAGEMVERGEILGEVGSTGISRGPHVHFEFVHMGNNCNPEPLFRPGMHRHDGQVVEVAQLEWAGAEAPEGLRCSPRPRHHPNSQWVVHENPGADADARSGLAAPAATP